MANFFLSQPLKLRPLIMTASAAALVGSGALYGAGLKEQQQVKKVRQLPLLQFFTNARIDLYSGVGGFC